MREDNARFGYFCSIALHLCVVLAALVSAFLGAVFPREIEEVPVVFEMVDNPPASPPPQLDRSNEIPQITTPAVKDVDPIDLPPPEPEPSPLPESKPEPEPKPEPKHVEKPKKISWEDFKRKNPHSRRRADKSATHQRNVVVPKINASTGNIGNIANISVKLGSSGAMKNILSAYIQEIYLQARRNWSVPASVSNLVAVVEFRVSRTGVISGLRIKDSSSDAEFDESVLAVFRSISLRSPPDNEPHTITISFKAG